MYDFTEYLVTFKNGNTIVMTKSCLYNCYLNTIDDSVKSYKIK